MKKREFVLQGLSCPNCAAKIEDNVKSLPEVTEVNLNLINRKLSVTVKDHHGDRLLGQIKKIVASHEPDVKVIDLSEDMGHNHHNHNSFSDEEENHKVIPYMVRLVASLLLALIFSYGKFPDHIRLLGLLTAYVLSGYEIILAALKNIAKGRVFDENFLMGFASLGAFIIGEQMEAVTVLVFYGIGEILQDMAVNKSRKNIVGLMDIRPDYANLIANNNISKVDPQKVMVGNMIQVKPGEKIPLDGIVVKGTSYIDSKALTGESLPIEVQANDLVYSGSINTSGVLEVKVTKAYGESTVSKILELVENASSKKAESEKFITKFARYYTPIVVFLALGVAVFPPLFGFGSFTTWIYRALSFLIISCPCALVISIPLSFFGGIGGSAKRGILVKGGNYLDDLHQVDTIVFDKTGTLTKGNLMVRDICPEKGVSQEQLLSLAAIAEKNSNHPIAKSILSFYQSCNLPEIADPLQLTELAGQGIIAKTYGGNIYCGNEKLMKNHGILGVTKEEKTATYIHIALDKKYLGYILVADEIKKGVDETIKALKELGVSKTVMLTGDHKGRAEEVARKAGIDQFHGQLLPQDKVSILEEYKSKIKGKGKIVFVGDGINDAPVLAGADIGIAMGGIGSDAAIEAADVVLMNDDIALLATAIRIARKTRRIVVQNIIFALATKILIMILAFAGITSIWFAIFADVGVALIALMNALRVLKNH